MEQAVWATFGVIAVVIGFAIVVQLINTHTIDKKLLSLEGSLQKLGNQCTFVCDSAPDTKLPVRVDLPSGMLLKTSGKRICAIYNEKTSCEVCLCNVSMEKPLNLSGVTQFSMHSYECTFLRLENENFMECQG